MKRFPLLNFGDHKTLRDCYELLKNSPSGAELVGLCQGIVADGIVTISESEYLVEWIESKNLSHNNYLSKALIIRLKDYVENGYIDAEDRNELFKVLQSISQAKKIRSGTIFNNDIPFSDKSYTGDYQRKKYCITGRCIFATRNKCITFLEAQGATYSNNISKTTDVLIVGSLKTNSIAKNSTKITKALQWQNEGQEIAIISETRWLQTIFNNE